MPKLTDAQQFFYDHAGASYRPGVETLEQGRVRGARRLAAVEKAAAKRGFGYSWSIDPGVNSSEFSDEKPVWRLWRCVMRNRDGGVVNSLHGIDFGRDGGPSGSPYRRVVEAELAIDGLTNPPQ